ncbi:MAG: DUF4190 domain-containing protein [bacterium]|nr:DUF4190 domain-containing protein [bacterium]
MNVSPQPQFSSPVQSDKASSEATTALVLGILSIACCTPLGIAAWIIGSGELKRIQAGLSSPAGKGFALAGMIMGIIGTIFLIISVIIGFLYLVFFGGMALFSGGT